MVRIFNFFTGRIFFIEVLIYDQRQVGKATGCMGCNLWPSLNAERKKEKELCKMYVFNSSKNDSLRHSTIL